jgi:competence protein ComEC
MGEGIDWMIFVAVWVTHLPGAVGRMAAFETGPLLAVTAGILLVCLLKTPLRWCGAVLFAAGTLWALSTPLPDVLVAADGQSLAVRGRDGRLQILRNGNDTFAAREWLAADGDGRAPSDAGLRAGFTCDPAGCIGRLADGALVSLARAPSAFEEDCRQAALVVSQRTAPPGCAAQVIDRPKLRANGAVALVRSGDHWTVKVARPVGSGRPWARLVGPAETVTLPETIPRPNAADATPRNEDIEPGD